MHVSVSTAELQVFTELQHRHLCTDLETQKAWTFTHPEDEAAGTVIDFYWNVPHRYAVYLDGPHHQHVKIERRDQWIDEALRRRGVRVDRFAYQVPLRKGRLMEICDRIAEVLKHG